MLGARDLDRLWPVIDSRPGKPRSPMYLKSELAAISAEKWPESELGRFSCRERYQIEATIELPLSERFSDDRFMDVSKLEELVYPEGISQLLGCLLLYNMSNSRSCSGCEATARCAERQEQALEDKWMSMSPTNGANPKMPTTKRLKRGAC